MPIRFQALVSCDHGGCEALATVIVRIAIRNGDQNFEIKLPPKGWFVKVDQGGHGMSVAELDEDQLFCPEHTPTS